MSGVNLDQKWCCLRVKVTIFASVLAIMFSAASPTTAMTITNDLGGSVHDRIVQVKELTADATEVRIVGTCISACTLLLGVPQSCVSPTARLGFHGPATRRRGLPLPHVEYERVSEQMAALYPPEIGRWFMAEARHVTGDYIVISGGDAIRMGARVCD